MNNKNSIRNTNIVASLFVVALILMVIGVSYAAYTFTGTGTKENVITTGQISVAFAEENNIKIENRYPETDEEGLASIDPNSTMTFTVSSNIAGDATINYAVGLTDIVEGTTLKQKDIKIYLTKNGNVANGFTEDTGETVKSFASATVDGFLSSHVITQGSLTGTSSDTYTLKAWINKDYNLPINNTSSGNNHSVTTISEAFSFKIKVVGTDTSIQVERVLDTSGANAPVLATNMIPVTYNGENWVKADSSNKNEAYQWHDYDSKMWANAVTVTEVEGSRADLVDAEVGTVIPMERINTMLVWIPRFSATGDTANYNGGTKDAPGAFNITFVDRDVVAHDAFTFGSQTLSGIWVGKFENSSDTTCTPVVVSAVGEGCNLTTIRPKVLPNVSPWRGAMVSTFFYDILAMSDSENQYGFDKSVDTTLDTHMMKNNEWAAVLYLSQSIYGRCISSTECVSISSTNINQDVITGYGNGSTAAYNTTLGMDASTTGNIYGVYDMNGVSSENVMGVYWDGSKKWSGGSNLGPDLNYHSGFNGWLSLDGTNYTGGVAYPNDNKYYNLYTTESAYTSAGLQHALTETKGYYNGAYILPDSMRPWIYRSYFGSALDAIGTNNGVAINSGFASNGASRLSIVVD